mmetsp:Transcript_17206/g.66963  ORF Transcript_17206/g.66963 Transcript_17206/m.66963 type:complete len:229 (-) Transcript_17206:13-699(-)
MSRDGGCIHATADVLCKGHNLLLVAVLVAAWGSRAVEERDWRACLEALLHIERTVDWYCSEHAWYCDAALANIEVHINGLPVKPGRVARQDLSQRTLASVRRAGNDDDGAVSLGALLGSSPAASVEHGVDVAVPHHRSLVGCVCMVLACDLDNSPMPCEHRHVASTEVVWPVDGDLGAKHLRSALHELDGGVLLEGHLHAELILLLEVVRVVRLLHPFLCSHQLQLLP